MAAVSPPPLDSLAMDDSYSPANTDFIEVPFNHLITPHIDTPLVGGDLESDLSFQDVLITVGDDEFVANSIKLKIVSAYFLGRLTSFAPEEEKREGQHTIALPSDEILTSTAVAAALSFVEALFEGRYHSSSGTTPSWTYDHTLALNHLTDANVLAVNNVTEVIRTAEYFQIMDLLPVCTDFIRLSALDKSNFISILRDGHLWNMDSLKTYINERFLVSSLNMRREKYGSFDLRLDYNFISMDCHSSVVGHFSSVLSKCIKEEAKKIGQSSASVRSIDMSNLLGKGLEESLFSAVEWMYFKRLDIKYEALYKVLRVAKELNVVQLSEKICEEYAPVTAEEWLCLYRVSKELNSAFVHRRTMLHFIRGFEVFSTVIENVDFSDLLKVVKSDLGFVSEKVLLDGINRWHAEGEESERRTDEHSKLLTCIRRGLLYKSGGGGGKSKLKNGEKADRCVERSWPSSLYLAAVPNVWFWKYRAWEMWSIDLITLGGAKCLEWKYRNHFICNYHTVVLNSSRDTFYYLVSTTAQEKPYFVLHSFNPSTKAMKRSVAALKCGPAMYPFPIADTDRSGRFVVTSAAPTKPDVVAVPHAVVFHSHSDELSVQFVNSETMKKDSNCWTHLGDLMKDDGVAETRIVYSAVRDTAFIFGGGTMRSEREMKTLTVTDTKTARVHTIDDKSLLQYEAAFADHGEHLVKVGGWINDEENGKRSVANVDVIDPERMTRAGISLPPLTHARHGAAAISLGGGRIFVAGGWTWNLGPEKSGPARRWHKIVTTFEIYNPEIERWTVGNLPQINSGNVKLFLVPKSVKEVDSSLVNTW
jgi:hypothetical protein